MNRETLALSLSGIAILPGLWANNLPPVRELVTQADDRGARLGYWWAVVGSLALVALVAGADSKAGVFVGVAAGSYAASYLSARKVCLA